MGRHKTISDDEVLRIARELFRHHGHTATTRTIAEAAGISEAILYQRFGTKDDLFFAAVHPFGPDIEQLLGAKTPAGDARTYLRTVVARMGAYFGEVIPLALRMMTHPSFDPAALSRAQPMGSTILQEALAVRLRALVRRKQIAVRSIPTLARLLVGVAHDWALGNVFAHRDSAGHVRQLREMVDVIWQGLRGPDASKAFATDEHG